MKRSFLSIGVALSAMLATTACVDNSKSSLKHGVEGNHHEGEITPVINPENLTYYKDIKPLFESKCVSCHIEGGLAPFELTEYAMVQGFRKSIKAAVVSRTMPPWSADAGHQSYKNDASLSADELTMLVGWIDAGAKAGTEDQYVRSAAPAEFVSDIKIPVTQSPAGYLPVQERSDDYHCFIVPIGEEFKETPYITGFTTIPGNAKIVHHLIGYYAAPQIVEYLKELDAEEPGEGYTCYGGALPDRIGNPAVQAAIEARHPGALKLMQDNNHWVSQWAPGANGFDFPADSGFKVEVGGAFVMQMHYYTADTKGEVDTNTILGLKTAKTVAKPGFVYPLTNQDWLQARKNNSMVIPANGTATFATEQNLARITGYGRHVLHMTPDQIIKNVELHSTNLHMHATGASGTVTFEKAVEDSNPETLLSIGAWDIHWQRDYTFAESKVIPAAAIQDYKLKVVCNYKNDRATDTFGGFGSMDEMCFNFSFFSFELEPAVVATPVATPAAEAPVATPFVEATATPAAAK